MKTVTNTLAAVACTLVMSTTFIVAAVGPASASLFTPAVASPPAIVA